MRQATFRPDIQGLRALAVLAVVLYHAGMGLPGGFVGVDVFFVVSGFVIGGALLREWEERGDIDLRRFFLRRVRRLMPAFGVMVGVVTTVGIVLAPAGGQEQLGRTGIAASLFNANTYLMRQKGGYFEPALELNALLHTWSLSVEEQFYLVVPFVLLVAWRVGRRVSPGRGRLPVGLAVCTLGSVSGIFMLWLTYSSGIGATEAFYLAPARGWEFLFGVVVALMGDVLRSVPRPVAPVAASAGLTMVVWSMISFDGDTVFPGIATIVPVAGTALLIAAGQIDAQTFVLRGLAWRRAVTLGDLSYSWYLWHWPAIVFASAWWPEQDRAPAAAAIVSIALAVASYRLIEQPIRVVRRPVVSRTVQIGLASSLIGIVASFALVQVALRFEESDVVDSYAARHWPHLVGCDAGLQIEDLPAACRVGSGDVEVVVVGDSMALQLAEGVQAAFGPDATVTAAGLNACPFVDLRAIRDPATNHASRCRAFVDGTIDYLVESRPDVVFVASLATSWVTSDRPLSDPDGVDLIGVDERAAAWEQSLVRSLAPLVDAEIDVVLVHAPPSFGDWRPDNCSMGRLLFDGAACSRERSRTHVEASREPAHRAEVAAADALGVRSIDLVDEMCGSVCSTWDGQWLMRDANHLSVSASESLGPAIARLWFDDAVMRVVDQ